MSFIETEHSSYTDFLGPSITEPQYLNTHTGSFVQLQVLLLYITFLEVFNDRPMPFHCHVPSTTQLMFLFSF